jgi:hypothetical protein
MATAAAVLPLTWYAEDQAIGKSLNYTFSVWSSATANANANVEFPGPPAKLGDICRGNNDSRWIFVQASATITAGNVIYYNQQFVANVLASSSLIISSYGITYPSSNMQIAFAQFNNGNPNSIMLSTTQVVANPNDYFWACMGAAAGLQVNVATTSCQRGGVIPVLSNVVKGSIVTTADNASSISATSLINLYINTSLDPTTSSVSQTATDCFTVDRIRVSVTTTT